MSNDTTKILETYHQSPANWGDPRVRMAALRPEEPPPLTLEMLNDAQRQAIVAVAGDDRAAQERALATIAPTWGRTVAPPPRPEPKTPLEVYERIKETNPVMAARFAVANGIHDRK